MATWIVHLRIAENILKNNDGFTPSQFAIGNIAPDSGIPDEKWEKFNPPTEVTHYYAPEGSRHASDDLGFFRNYLLPVESDKSRYSFLWGFFCHLVADNLWSLRIGKPTREAFKAQFEANPEFIWEVKKDWYGLDLEYIRNHPDLIFWKIFINCEYPTNYLEFLNPQGVQERIEYIKTFYRRRDSETDEMATKQRIYLTEDRVDRFVEEATNILIQKINQLKNGAISTDEYHSILELL